MPKRTYSRPTFETSREERLIPEIRARLAKKLSHQGFRVSEIALALKVTQPAVTQYLKGRRGKALQGVMNVDILLDPLAEKLGQRSRSGLGVETAELLETARQVLVMNTGRGIITQEEREPRRGRLLELLGGRLRLELDAAEKYLELANRASDNYTKLLLRMIAADSIRHGDVISQLMSWLEAGGESEGSIPDEALLKSMLAIEDSAGEASLTKEVEVDHPVARLLLRWIDIDEGKHGKMVSGLVALSANRKKALQRRAPASG
jgi:predicted transcriptional regulator